MSPIDFSVVQAFIRTENNELSTPYTEETLQTIEDLLQDVGEPEYRPLAKLILWNWEYIEKGMESIPTSIIEAIKKQAVLMNWPWKKLAIYWLLLEGKDLRPKDDLLSLESV